MWTGRLWIALLSVLLCALARVELAKGQTGDEYLVGVGIADVTGPAAEIGMVCLR